VAQLPVLAPAPRANHLSRCNHRQLDPSDRPDTRCARVHKGWVGEAYRAVRRSGWRRRR
jgi:hypothetical protein